MFWEKYKLWITSAVVVVVYVSGVLIAKNVIANQVAKQTQEIQEKFAKEIADEKLKCETDKINQEKQYKEQIVELQTELERTKILLQKIEKQGKVTETIKKDVKSFMKEFDSLLGTKGQTNDK